MSTAIYTWKCYCLTISLNLMKLHARICKFLVIILLVLTQSIGCYSLLLLKLLSKTLLFIWQCLITVKTAIHLCKALRQQLLPFCLCSKQIETQEKEKIALKLQYFKFIVEIWMLIWLHEKHYFHKFWPKQSCMIELEIGLPYCLKEWNFTS